MRFISKPPRSDEGGYIRDTLSFVNVPRVQPLTVSEIGVFYANTVLLCRTRTRGLPPIVLLTRIRHVWRMTTSAPLRLSVEDKLDSLGKLDTSGRWQSLDDQRYCTRCDRVISGRQIEVAGGTRAHGPLRLECPTETCTATPADWRAPGRRNTAAARPSSSSSNSETADSHDAGYVYIHAKGEGIAITHDGRAAVVRRTRSGRLVRMEDIAQFSEPPPRRRRLTGWFARNVVSLATDGARLLSLLRPAARADFRPVH